MKLISDQVNEREIAILTRELQKVLDRGIPGAVVEFGCYVGTSSLFLQQLLVSEPAERFLHVYDSFAGLPEKQKEDASPAGEQFVAGELLATKAQFTANFKKAGLPVPVIHKAWFSELTHNDIPKQIAFAFLDGDYYRSILDPLKLIWDYLANEAIVVVDDYQNEQLPGVKKALDVWNQHHSFTLTTEASLAIVRKT